MINKKTIQRWNEHFNSLTKAEQRVVIAKDVLKQLKDGVFIPGSGYLSISSLPSPSDITLDAQSKINEITCTGCAMGACLLSLVKFTDKSSIADLENDDFDDRDSPFRRLKKYFSLRQLFMIEAVYEDNLYIHEGAEEGMAGEFGYYVSKKDVEIFDRLIELNAYGFHNLPMIMNNIIRNNGEFKPLDLPKSKRFTHEK